MNKDVYIKTKKMYKERAQTIMPCMQRVQSLK